MAKRIGEKERETWAQIFEAQLKSGLSVQEYCRQEDISERTFYRRMRRFQDRPANNCNPSGFIEIALPAERHKQNHETVDIVRGPWTIRINGQSSSELIQRVLHAVCMIERADGLQA